MCIGAGLGIHLERTTVLSDSVRLMYSASWSTFWILATSPALNCTPLALQRCSRSCLSLRLQTLQVPRDIRVQGLQSLRMRASQTQIGR